MHKHQSAAARPCLIALLATLLMLATLPALAAQPGKQRQPVPVFTTEPGGVIIFDGMRFEQEKFEGVVNGFVEYTMPEYQIHFVVHYPKQTGENSDYPLRLPGAEMLGGFLFDNMQRGEPFPDDLPYELYPTVITYEVSRPGPKVMSVNYRLWAYSGGAHDNWYYQAASVELESGRTITATRLFPQGVERAASWLSGPNRAYHTGYSVHDTEAPAEFVQIEVKPEDLHENRFILTPKGIDVLFAPYERGPFAMGDTVAHIPRSEFKNLGVNEAFWQ